MHRNSVPASCRGSCRRLPAGVFPCREKSETTRSSADSPNGAKLTCLVRAISLALVLAGPSAGPAFAVTLNLAQGGYAYPTAFGKLDPIAVGDCFEGLVAEDAKGDAIPGQASSWTISPDGLVYTFTLRDDIMWADGEPVIAADFLANFQWLFDPVNAVEYGYLQFPIRNAAAIASGTMSMDQLGVTVLDERTLQITLERPTPYFLQALTHSTAYPLPSSKLVENGADWLVPANVICNGPFAIVEQDGKRVRSVKSETYYDRNNVAVDQVNYYVIGDIADGLARVKAGQIDVFYNLPASADAWIDEHALMQSNIVPSLGVTYYAINIEKPPFDNVALRRALSMALDRDSIDPRRAQSANFAAYGLVPKGTANYADTEPYQPDWAAWSYQQRVATAAAAMATLGYTPENPLTLQIRYGTNSSESQQRIARNVASMWSRIGVKAELLRADPTEHFSALRTGDFDIGPSTWVLDYSDPHNVLEILTTGSEFNVGRYNNPAFEQLLADAAVEQDLEKRAALLASAEWLALDDVAVIPLNWVMVRNLVSDNVSGIVDNAKNVHRTRWLAKRMP